MSEAAPGRSANWLLVAALALAAALWTAGVFAHLRRACTVLDTPYLPLCPASAEGVPPSPAQLRERISRNPGDSTAWTRLLVQDSGKAQGAVLDATTALAPNHPNVLRRRAVRALEAGDLAEGVALLVLILQRSGGTEAGEVLAHLLLAPGGAALLQPHLAQARDWLPSLLAGLGTLKQPPSLALPLVAGAWQQKALDEASMRSYSRTLIQGGHWVEAYGLWLARHPQAVPPLFNGGFDNVFEADGFDWEANRLPRSRTGAQVQQHSEARRGMVLEVELTGRPLNEPIVQQYLFLPAGAYRLKGEYSATRLRNSAGLAWGVQCVSGAKAMLGRSAGLPDSGGSWRGFELAFTVPADCGPVARIRLETADRLDAAAGIKGRASFDALALQPAPSNAAQDPLAAFTQAQKAAAGAALSAGPARGLVPGSGLAAALQALRVAVPDDKSLGGS